MFHSGLHDNNPVACQSTEDAVKIGICMCIWVYRCVSVCSAVLADF